MQEAGRLVVVVVLWTLSAAIAGWIVFNYIYVEHGTVVLWVAGVGIGFVCGLLHVLILIEGRRRNISNDSK